MSCSSCLNSSGCTCTVQWYERATPLVTGPVLVHTRVDIAHQAERGQIFRPPFISALSLGHVVEIQQDGPQLRECFEICHVHHFTPVAALIARWHSWMATHIRMRRSDGPSGFGAGTGLSFCVSQRKPFLMTNRRG